MHVETVIIKGGEYGSIIINKSDFNEDEHELYVEGEEAVEYDRDALKAEAVVLELEFAPNIGNKKLFELIEAHKAKTEGGE